MLATSIFATATSVASWAAVFVGVSYQGIPAWAAMSGVIAALCWVNHWRVRYIDRELHLVSEEYRRRETALIKAASLLTGQPPTTGPLPRLYPVA